MEPWQQTVETRLSELRQDIRDLRGDFRWTWGLMITLFAAMLGAMAKGFGWL
jgi:hypothetical protein